MSAFSPRQPMPTPTAPPSPLLSYKLLSFDIYGTLIDWESSILTYLQPLIARLPQSHPLRDRFALAVKYNTIEARIQSSNPTLLYSKVLYQAYLSLAQELELGILDSDLHTEATAFGSSVGSWSAFPDTVNAMKRLSKYYGFLVPLSNVDRESFEATLKGPLAEVPFTTYYLAEDIGSYKPDTRNFQYLLEKVEGEYGVKKGEVLHVAQSLFHDHEPAKKVGLSSVWIARKDAGMGDPTATLQDNARVGYAWRFETLGHFADAVEMEAKKDEEN